MRAAAVVIACFAFAGPALAQPSLLPSAAKNVTTSSNKDGSGGMFTLVEQNGSIPNATGCEKTPTGSGTAIVRVQRYNLDNPGGKFMYDQIRQSGAPMLEVKNELENGRAGANTSYPSFKSATPLVWEPVEGGQAGSFTATLNCVMATNTQYTIVDLRAWAVQGPNIIKLVISFAGDAAQAKKYQQEVFDKLKKADFSKL